MNCWCADLVVTDYVVPDDAHLFRNLHVKLVIWILNDFVVHEQSVVVNAVSVVNVTLNDCDSEANDLGDRQENGIFDGICLVLVIWILTSVRRCVQVIETFEMDLQAERVVMVVVCLAFV